MPATTDGLWYELQPGPSGAATVLLSSGLGGSASFWAPQLEALKKRFSVLLYDHRGTGRSVRELTEPHSVDAMAADMRIVMDAAKVKQAHIVGHAAGGLAGLALALKSPKRIGKLVVVNGWSKPDPHIARCFESRIALLRKSGKRAYVRAQPIFLYPAAWISENTARLDAEEERMVKGFPSVDVMLERIDALLAFDIDAKLPKIAAPVLVSASVDDMLVPVTCSKRLAERLPNATLDITPWGGHAMSVTDPEVFNSTLVEFLSN
ncbi:MAG TPA: pyrimidine utilization protein D [Hyphomonadaceae bacterium]|jgi:aminoacrylate hydrolase|nr:pyrimidine utilization protein D [Hyphomonadaceae bacterium]